MPRNPWSKKDERQYEHIKDSELESGVKEDRAEEIAARTVNKQRRLEGRTMNRRTMGTGNPRTPLAERTRDELYNLASDLDIRRRSRMRKDQLVDAIESARGSGR
ncbi:MAG: Rho termination factor N-terminal domain-containing protein [Dehalococcoidia bacterium]|nr:Rho termination factor N-terminal domain-containing protein [Dehalococcoidia bacterium]